MKGLFIPGITAEMFRNGCLESIEELMAEGEIYDIDHPTESEERKTGKWIVVGKSRGLIPSDDFKCSVCGNFLDFRGVNAGRGDANYCPNCGASMEGGPN